MTTTPDPRQIIAKALYSKDGMTDAGNFILNSTDRILAALREAGMAIVPDGLLDDAATCAKWLRPEPPWDKDAPFVSLSVREAARRIAEHQ